MANNKIAYGLAKEHGINTDGMEPREVWEALKKKGVTLGADDAVDNLGNGTIIPGKNRYAPEFEKYEPHKEFKDKQETDNFFFYDDENRGLLAKKNSTHGKWEKMLTPHQRFAMGDYASDGYGNINSYLRGYDNGEKYSVDFVKGKIKALDSAIELYQLREPIVTYRSVDSSVFVEYLDDFEKLTGEEYCDKAFMSTSPNPYSSALNKDLLMTIKLPKGTGIGAYIEDYNSFKESEFLLARGQRFLITKAYKKNQSYYVEMELIKND